MLALVLFVTASAVGQVQRMGSGQALDANPRIGGDGRNTPAPVAAPVNSQLYVTGQVSGLRRFHGQVGYYAENELRLNLPSASLSGFHRQSVGLQDVLQGPSYQPAPYYDRTTTTLNARDIVAGRTIPGTTGAGGFAPAASPLGQKLYVNAVADFYSVNAQVPGMALAPPLPGSALSADAGTAPGTAGPSRGRTPVPSQNWTAPSLFGVPRDPDQGDLAQELYRQAKRQGLLDSRLEARVDSMAAGSERHKDTATEAGPIEAVLPGTDRTPGGVVGREPGRPRPDQDVLMDMMLLSRPEPKAGPGATTQPAAAPASRAPAGALVTREEGGGIVLHGLAGRSRDPFNLRMTQAGETLRGRRYYDAVRLYAQAGRITPHNPLARIGMGMSLLGAGETLSAAHQVHRALSLFPPMMQSRIDLDTVLDAKVIDAQLGAIDDRLRTADEKTKTMLRFLAAFLYANTGKLDKAQPYAEKVRDSSGDANLLRAYAEFLLRTRRQEDPAAPKENPAGTGDGGTSTSP